MYQTSTIKESLKNYQKVIKSFLRDAAYYFGFIENNLTGDLQIPRILSFELKNDVAHIYSNDEIRIILNRLKKDNVFITACYTGMRTGEVFALTWNDIDSLKDNRNYYIK